MTPSNSGSAWQSRRTCCGCGTKNAPKSMLRVASFQKGAPQLDFEGKKPGRGTYLCLNGRCVEKALQRRALERTLKLESPLGGQFKEELRTALATSVAAAKHTSQT